MNKKFISLIFIIIAGEAVFMLPFLIPRLFRPIMLEAWNITNTDIGLAFGAYGITSMISYLIGGPFADKYPPRNLIVTSLLITLIGGIALILSPSKMTLILTYAYFGVSTILLMWGALIKVTHEVGGERGRSTAMGILDSGRGLSAAVVSSILTALITYNFSELKLQTQKVQALNLVIVATGVFIILSAIGVWIFLKDIETKEAKKHDWDFERAKLVFKNLNVWLLGIIILTSYCGYKNVDNYSVYMVDVHQFSLMDATKFTSIIFWARPIAALIAGILADRIAINIKGGRFINLAVLLLLGGVLQFLLALNLFNSYVMILSTVIFAASFAYALRAIYFSVFGDLHIPENIIGTTVGIVSLVGYLPDMFFAAITGNLIDTYPGAEGFSYVFYLTGSFLFIGGLASLICYKRVR